MRSTKPTRGTRVVIVLVWAVTAALASSVTSWAVTVIGSERGSARDRVLTGFEVAAALAGQIAASTAGATPAPTVDTTPEAPPEQPSTEPSTQPSEQPPGQPPPTAVGTPTTSVPPSTPAATPQPAEVVRTWALTGGQVSASCRGAAFTLLYATPNDGWTVDVRHSGADGTDVEFRRPESDSTLDASCVDGVPTIRTEADGDKSSGDN